MAKLNLSSKVSEQVSALFNKALTSKSATSLIGLRITVDPTEIIPVTIKSSNASALLGWIEPGQEAKEIWPSWLTRRGTSSETGEVFSNLFIVDDEKIRLSPQDVVETIISSDLLLEEVNYHEIIEAVFSSTGQRTGEKSIRRPFFTWRVLPRREIPQKTEWSQEILDKISKNDPDPSPAEEDLDQRTAATKDDTSDDVPF